jgi:hypothetical protein
VTSTPTRTHRASGTPLEIRALREDDDRTPFRSGDADLDRFFHQFAGQNQFRLHLGVTYVAVEDRTILGFATVAAAHVEIDDLHRCSGSLGSPSTNRPKGKDSASTFFGSSFDWRYRWPTITDASA